MRLLPRQSTQKLGFNRQQISRCRRRTASRNGRNLRLEPLEERTVLSGIVLTSVNGVWDYAADSFVAPDNDIIVVGTADRPEGWRDFAVLRYNPNGTLDSSFGDGDGMVTTSISKYANHANAVAAYPGNRIVVVGSAGEAIMGLATDVAVARYNEDGSLDASFGGKGKNAGKLQLDLGGDESFSSVLIQPDGKIIAGGSINSNGTHRFLLVRFTESGQLDASFGTNGVVETSIRSVAQVNAVAIQDDKILAVGRTNGTDPDFALARYNMDGTLDDGGPLDLTLGDRFGTDGIVTTDFVGDDWCYDVAVDTESRIVVAGSVWKSGIRGSFAVARYTSDGAVDTSFGSGGLIYNDDPFPVSPDHGAANGVVIQDDGKIVVAGSSNCYDPAEGAIHNAFGVVRYNPDGTPDVGFGVDGGVTTSIMSSVGAHSLVIQDGKLVVSGQVRGGSSQSFVGMVRYDADGSLDTAFGGQVNVPPLAVGDLANTPKDTAVIVDVLDNDLDYDLSDEIQIESITQGDNGSVTHVDGTATVTYTPGPGFIGIDTFTYTISDGYGGTDTGTVAVNVGGVNTAPVAITDTATTEFNTAVTIAVLYNDWDVDGDPINISSVEDPANGTAVDNGDGTITYTPDQEFNGEDTFTYTTSDGTDYSNPAAVQITVAAVAENNPPVAVADNYSTAVDTILSIATPGVLDNDSDVDGDAFSAVPISNGATANGGQVTLNGDGSFTYIPPAEFTGTDTFGYTITDGDLNSAPATVSINVTSGSANVVYVADIFFESKANKGKDWRAVFQIRTDSDGDGIAEETDDEAVDATITVTFAGNTYTGTTDSNGVFTTGWIKNLRGYHGAQVTQLALLDYLWDMGLGEDDSEEDYDLFPDEYWTF